MDTKNSERSPDRVEAAPEQQQVTNILHLIDILSAGGPTAGGWRDKGYLVSNFGDSITSISVSRLTEQGQREKPSSSLAVLRIFRRSEDGRIETDYSISKDKEKLRIDRYERITPPEEEKRNQEETLRFKEKVKTMTDAQGIEALQNILKRSEKRDQERAFERKIGESYVGSIEATQILDILTKLAGRQGLPPST